MFELLPLAALLGAPRFGELIKKLNTYVIRKEEEREEAARARPKVQVTGPKVQPLVCQICLGRIKEGTEYVKCAAGKVFHSVCLARVGSCPFCTRTVAIKGMESTTAAPHNLVLAFLPPELAPAPPPPLEAATEPLPPVPEEGEAGLCPICKAPVEAGASACGCGAIFGDRGGLFSCPQCKGAVRIGERSCARCGEPFEWLEPNICPECGKEIEPGAEVCECGVLLSDKCPECGARLGESDLVCWNCGTEFGYK